MNGVRHRVTLTALDVEWDTALFQSISRDAGGPGLVENICEVYQGLTRGI